MGALWQGDGWAKPALANFDSDSSSSSKQEPTALDKAAELIDAGDYAGAVSLLEGYVADNPDDADGFNLLGYALRHQERYEASHEAYQQALAIDPEHEEALEYLGELYLQTGKLDEAEATLARLDEACGFFGCEEEDELAEAIEAYKAENR
jgi:Flp pilus assembly protein TadD